MRNRNYILVFLLFWGTIASHAQCAMCRAALESQDNSQQAEAVNDGIVYLMAFPYILVGVMGYFIYRSRRKNPEATSL